MNVQIRWLIRRDLPEVLQIENSSFEYVWTEENFLDALRRRNCIGMVAEYQHQIVGFVIYELHKKMIDVLDFAVHPDFRREQIGTQFMNRLKGKLSQQRRSQLNLIVRESNLSALKFFQKNGFLAERVFRNYFEDASEDAYLMTFHMERSDSDYSPGLEPRNRISKYLKDA